MTANQFGNSSAVEAARATWCTPLWLAELIGPVDLDPCGSPRSHIRARLQTSGPDFGQVDGIALAAEVPAQWRVFVNPPYSQGQVIRWIRAYAHSDFAFLLRWDPSTAWFGELARIARWVWFPLGRRIEFEPPPGVKASSNPFPHALFLAEAPNEALRAAGISLEVRPSAFGTAPQVP